MSSIDEKLPPMRMGELGYSGLMIDNGVVRENILTDLTFPNAINTYKEMGYDSSVASAITTIEDFIYGVDWSVEEPEGLDPKYPKGFIQQCMDDLDRDWKEVVQDALSIVQYGFCVQEKVYKRRKGDTGKHPSKHNDNLLGWAKLPVRSQDTISKWIYSEDGRELKGVQQDLSLVSSNAHQRFINRAKTKNNIPRAKFMLQRYRPLRDNPNGNSPLNSAYISWKYKTKIEEFEAIGVSRDMGGMLIIELPPEYLSEDASEDKKAVADYCKKLIRNYQANQSAGIVFPRYIDPESKQNLFSLKLQGVEGGGKQYDTQAIISRYEKKILMTFLADVLGLGHDQVGSYALSSDKTNLLAIKIATFLAHITKVFNEDLIKQTFVLNGWDTSVLPKIVHSDLEKQSLDDLGKYIQRIASVGAIEKDKALHHFLRDQLPLGTEGVGEALDSELVSSESRAGEGQGTSGTGNSQDGGAGSDTNSDNKASVHQTKRLVTKEDYEEYKGDINGS